MSDGEGKQSPVQNNMESTPVKDTETQMNIDDISHVISDPVPTQVDEPLTSCSQNDTLSSILLFLNKMEISRKEEMKNMQISLEKKMEENKEEIKMVQASINKTEKRIDEWNKKLDEDEEIVMEIEKLNEEEVFVEEMVTVEEKEVNENEKLEILEETGQVSEIAEKDDVKDLEEKQTEEKESEMNFNYFYKYYNGDKIIKNEKDRDDEYNKREQLFENKIKSRMNVVVEKQLNLSSPNMISLNNYNISINAPLALSFELQTDQTIYKVNLNSISCVAIFNQKNKVINVRYNKLDIIKWEVIKKLYRKAKFIFKKIKFRDKIIYKVSHKFIKC